VKAKKQKPRTKKKNNLEGAATPFQINLNSIIEERDLTFKDIASMSEVSQSTVFGWANGASPNNIAVIHKLSKKLNVDFQWLLTGESSSKDFTGVTPEDFYDEDYLETEGIYKVKLYKLTPKTNKLPTKKG
jgi:transcriptional regulator with XRE-family HTH domain